MAQEHDDYADLDRRPKRRIFTPVQKLVFALGIALGLAMLLPEVFMWAWRRWGP